MKFAGKNNTRNMLQWNMRYMDLCSLFFLVVVVVVFLVVVFVV